MIAAFILLTLSCPQPKIVNTSKLPWNAEDQKELVYAQRRCGEIYGKSGECLIWIKKYADRQFSAMCGEKR